MPCSMAQAAALSIRLPAVSAQDPSFAENRRDDVCRLTSGPMQPPQSAMMPVESCRLLGLIWIGQQSAKIDSFQEGAKLTIRDQLGRLC